jgi:hypothetical protein
MTPAPHTNAATPDMTIWTKSAPSWARLDSNLPQEPAQPGPVK